jgi:hypothetical protein
MCTSSFTNGQRKHIYVLIFERPDGRDAINFASTAFFAAFARAQHTTPHTGVWTAARLKWPVTGLYGADIMLDARR